MIKVLHIGKYYPPFFGGIEKVNFDLVENLNNSKIKTDVLCFNHQKGKTLVEEKSGYKIIRCATFLTLFSTPISFSIFKNLKSIYKQYDIIHIHLPNPVAAVAFQFLDYKGKIVLHWHMDIFKQKFVKFFYKPFQEHLLKKADAIIVTSPTYLKTSNDLKNYREKCHVVPIGINNTHLTENLDFRKDLENEYRNKTVVFSLGRLIYYKGFEYLIDAAQKLDENTIILIGGTGTLKEKLKKRIKEKKVEDKVQLLGKILQEKLKEYYNRADLFCLPSIERTEAFGIVLIEAMSMSLPVISTNIGTGTSWINQHNETGFVVPPKDANALARAIKKIADDPDLKKEFAENAVQRFQKNFKLERMIDRLLELYNQNLKSSVVFSEKIK